MDHIAAEMQERAYLRPVSLDRLMEIPEDIELRPITPEDLPEVHGVMRRSEVKDNEPMVTQFDEVVSEYEAPFFDPNRTPALASIAEGGWSHGPRPGTGRAPCASTAPISSAASTPNGGGGASGPPFSPGSCSGPGNW